MQFLVRVYCMALTTLVTNDGRIWGNYPRREFQLGSGRVRWLKRVAESFRWVNCDELWHNIYVCILSVYIYIYIESILIREQFKKKDVHIRTPQKVHKANGYFGELVIRDLSDMVCILHLPDLLALSAAFHSIYKWQFAIEHFWPSNVHQMRCPC